MNSRFIGFGDNGRPWLSIESCCDHDNTKSVKKCSAEAFVIKESLYSEDYVSLINRKALMIWIFVLSRKTIGLLGCSTASKHFKVVVGLPS